MEKFVVDGGRPLHGEITVSGAKNVALKAFVAALLTDEPLVIHNVPRIRDVVFMLEVLSELGVHVAWQSNHTVIVTGARLTSTVVPLEVGARLRTSSLVLGPMLARFGEATIPNPGGCRLGARPIDRHIEALKCMGADITYDSNDGYFHASAAKLHGATITFQKNTHTGTEALILAGVMAQGTTVLKNAAEEVEIDDLIALLNTMGGQIVRSGYRQITIQGVEHLHGAEMTLMSDRNEEVTFALAASVTHGALVVKNSNRANLTAFLEPFIRSGGSVTPLDATTTQYSARSNSILPSDIVTAVHPGFMTDWQAPWALWMTQANGMSTIHETVFESRFTYVKELEKMGAHIDFFDPEIVHPEDVYNFNLADQENDVHQAIRIYGPMPLHNAVVEVNDIRAGATMLLAALAASGTSYIHRIEQIDRGYEHIEERLNTVGASIRRSEEEE